MNHPHPDDAVFLNSIAFSSTYLRRYCDRCKKQRHTVIVGGIEAGSGSGWDIRFCREGIHLELVTRSWLRGRALSVVRAHGPDQLSLDRPEDREGGLVGEPRGRLPFDARADEVADEDDLRSQKGPRPIDGLDRIIVAQSAAQEAALIEQIASVHEPHTEGEFIAAPRRPAPFTESPLQQSDLVFDQDLAWPHKLFGHASRLPILVSAAGRSNYLFRSLLQEMREQASEAKASWRSRRRSQRIASRLNWCSKANVCSTTYRSLPRPSMSG